jgi:hypothetical protein
MALDKATLKTNIEAIAGAAPYPATAADAATEFATALETYFLDGTANALSIIPPGPGAAIMEPGLLAGFTSGNAAGAAAGFATAFSAFWAAAVYPPPFIPPAVPAAGAALLTPALTTELAILSSDAGTKAQAIADAIDTATKAVVANFLIGGVPTPFPVL